MTVFDEIIANSRAGYAARDGGSRLLDPDRDLVPRRDVGSPLWDRRAWQWPEDTTEEQVTDNLLSLFGSRPRVYEQVSGRYLVDIPGKKMRGGRCRIDLIIAPRQQTWEEDGGEPYIGIECKRPDAKAGPALSQMMDYRLAEFYVPNVEQPVRLSRILLWPCTKFSGVTQSILVQQRLGIIAPYSFKSGRATTAVLHSGSGRIGVCDLMWGLTLESRPANVRNGRKVGSR